MLVLQEIDLKDNNISFLPEELAKMPLMQLNLSSNMLTGLELQCLPTKLVTPL